MVVRVKLEGLNIVKGRQPNTWYVYRRGGGSALIKGFIGSREDLEKKLAEPEMVQAYNRPRLLSKPASDLPIEALGGFVHWFTCGAIDGKRAGDVEDGYPKWWKLADATRKDYLKAYEYLRPEFDMPLAGITQPMLYETRDKCANRKWPRFADQMIAALSSMFRQAVKRGKMPFNPCIGMDKAHSADPNANREWFPGELLAVLAVAPMEVKIPLMLARYAGLRGQTIVRVDWKQRREHPVYGMVIQLITRKNQEPNFLPEPPELQAFLADLKVRTASGCIALRDDGKPWNSEVEMQTRVSHWLRDRERDGLIGTGTTLHGLRVSYAAWWKRNGATTSEVADLLGDRSERMGKHYTRHVEREVNVIRAFERVKDKG